MVLHPLPLFRGPGLLKMLHFNPAGGKGRGSESFDVVQSFEKTCLPGYLSGGEGCHREWLFQRRKYEPFSKTMGVVINPFHRLTLILEQKAF